MSKFLYFILISLLISCSRRELSRSENPDLTQTKTDQIKARTIIDGPSDPDIKSPFIESTKKWGLDEVKALRFYAVDWDHDGDTDLVTLSSYDDSPQFFRFDKKRKKFIPVIQSPIESSMRASFLIFADFNKDGLLDILGATLNQKSELSPRSIELYLAIKIDGKIFYKLKKEQTFPPMPTSSISVADYNMDGLLDLYIGNWFSFKNENKQDQEILPYPDRLYFGVGDGTDFEDRSDLLAEYHYKKDKTYPNALPTFGTMACDVDQNGYPDILTASSSRFKNRLLLNLTDNNDPKKRKFWDRGEQSGVAYDDEKSFSKNHGGNSFYLNCADYNNDGIVDLALGELFYAFDEESQDRSSILTGSSLDFPPKFIRTEYHKDDGSGRWGQGDRRSLWRDFNGDGLLDLLVENSGVPPYSRLILFEQESDHAFVDKAKEYGLDLLNPSGIVTIDLDQDGDWDIISGQSKLRDHQIKDRIYLFENHFKNKSLKIFLRGKKANTRGLGSTIILKTNLATYRRFVSAVQGSIPSQSEEGVIFNLQKNEKVLSVTVRWPLLVESKKQRPYPLLLKYELQKYKKLKTLILSDDGKIKVN